MIEIIKSYPAYDVIKGTTRYNVDALYLDGSLPLALAPNFMRHYTISSVMSYALKYNECPIQAYEDAKKKGHNIYWINGRGSMITSTPQARETYIAVEIGQRVYFQGKLFEIVAEPNDNLGLKEITE